MRTPSPVADHRKHHAHTDEEGDPNSPHVSPDGGVKGVFSGLWHAHPGWLMSSQGRADRKRYAPDLHEDRGMRTTNRRFPFLVFASLALPALAGFLVTGTPVGALTGLLWGGFVRIFFVHHVTWSVNPVCHFLGNRRFETDDHSTNVFWLALPSLGESWHHNHHAFPLRRPRPQALGARPLGGDHHDDGQAGAGAKRGSHPARAPGLTSSPA